MARCSYFGDTQYRPDSDLNGVRRPWVVWYLMGEESSANGNGTWVVVVARVFTTALPLRGCRLHGLQDAPSFKMVAGAPPNHRGSFHLIWPSFLKFATVQNANARPAYISFLECNSSASYHGPNSNSPFREAISYQGGRLATANEVCPSQEKLWRVANATNRWILFPRNPTARALRRHRLLIFFHGEVKIIITIESRRA